MRAIERKVYILLTKEQFNNENFKINWNDLVNGHVGCKLYSLRSEERRVGKECRSRWSPYH